MSKVTTESAKDYWKNVRGTDIELLSFIFSEDEYGFDTISWGNTDLTDLNIELGDWDIWFGKYAPIVKVVNEIDTNSISLHLDRTYVHNLLAPTEEELDYLELVFGAKYVKLYRQSLDIIEQELER